MTINSSKSGEFNAAELRELILGMRAAYDRGENAMEFARSATGTTDNSTLSALIAYDLQAGSYIEGVRNNTYDRARWCAQIAEIINPFLDREGSILEVGSGEATTLEGVLRGLARVPRFKLGFDISWSRCAAGLGWLAEQQAAATLFVADLFHIPLADESIDVVYTSHSLEPNGGRESAAIRELMRVARRAVVMVEPIYELASPQAQLRMRTHGYVRGLREAAEHLGAVVGEYRLLDYRPSPSNPSGVILIAKDARQVGVPSDEESGLAWRCPLTNTPMRDAGDAFVADQAGLVYPVLRRIPLLRAEHGVVASKFVG